MRLKSKTKEKILLGVMTLAPIFNFGGIGTEVSAVSFLKGAAKSSELSMNEVFNALKVVKLADGGVRLAVGDSFGKKSLHWAALDGNKDTVGLLLKRKVDVNARNDIGWTALHCAILGDNEEMVKCLLMHCADINAKTNAGETALHYAAQIGNKGIVELLLANGADIDAETNAGDTVLHYAVQMGNRDVVELLLANGVDINAENKCGETALCWANRFFHAAIVDLLREAADKSATPMSKGVVRPRGCSLSYGVMPPCCMASKRPNRDVDINARDGIGGTALHYAAQMGNKDIVESLLANGADINAKNQCDETALDLARKNGYEDIVDLLQKAAIDRSAVSISSGLVRPRGGATLQEMFETQEWCVVDEGSRSGAVKSRNEVLRPFGVVRPRESTSPYGVSTPCCVAPKRSNRGISVDSLWFEAARCGNVAVVQSMLLSGRVEVNAKDEFGLTALNWAAQFNNLEVVRFLLSNDALDLEGNDGVTALHWAALNRNAEMVRLLLDNYFGISLPEYVNKTDNYNQTALFLAALSGDIEVASMLVNSGAECNEMILNAARQSENDNLVCYVNSHLSNSN